MSQASTSSKRVKTVTLQGNCRVKLCKHSGVPSTIKVGLCPRLRTSGSETSYTLMQDLHRNCSKYSQNDI